MTRVPARRRMYVAFLVGVLVGLLLWLPWSLPAPERPTDGARVLVDARLPLRSEGLVIPFTVAAGTTVAIDLDLPAMLECQATVGPLYLALRPEPILEPEPREERTHRFHGCETPVFEETFRKAGAYAIRIPPIPTAMGMESEMFVDVRVTARRAAGDGS